MMININIESEYVAELLTARVGYWTDDDEVISLFSKMYENRCEQGCYCGDFDVMKIVDNDYVNNCDIISKGEEYFDELLKLYEENEWDCSETTCYSYIEAVDNEYEPKMFLVCY